MLRAIGRHAESPPELLLELVGNTAFSDPNPYSYRVLGTREDVDRAANKQTVLQVLTDAPQDISELTALTLLDPKAVRVAADELVNEGKAIREGKGVKGDPFTYRLPEQFVSNTSGVFENGTGLGI